MRRLLRALAPLAVLTVLTAVGLEAHAAWTRAQARGALLAALEAPPSVPLAPGPAAQLDAARHLAHRGHDAAAAERLQALAEQAPSARHAHLAALARTWDGGREAAAATWAERAARLAPTDPALAQEAEDAFDRVLLAAVRRVTRPLGLLAGALLGLLLLRRAAASGQVRCRRRWAASTRAQVLCRVDGRSAEHGREARLPAQAERVHLDVLLAPSPACPRPRAEGPTLSVVLSSGSGSRSVRLAPRRDVREDALRLPLSDSTLAVLRAHPGRWRAAVALDGHPVGEALLQVEPPVVGRAAG